MHHISSSSSFLFLVGIVMLSSINLEGGATEAINPHAPRPGARTWEGPEGTREGAVREGGWFIVVGPASDDRDLLSQRAWMGDGGCSPGRFQLPRNALAEKLRRRREAGFGSFHRRHLWPSTPLTCKPTSSWHTTRVHAVYNPIKKNKMAF